MQELRSNLEALCPGFRIQLVAFLLSDSAAAITGQDILICGGASLRGQ
jgi:hypothetical protein